MKCPNCGNEKYFEPILFSKISDNICLICDNILGIKYRWLVTKTYLNPDHCGYRCWEENYETFETKEEALNYIKEATKPYKHFENDPTRSFKLCLVIEEYDTNGEIESE